MVFELEGGDYRLEGCVGLVGVKNVTIQSRDINIDLIDSVIKCANNNDSNYGNLYVCGSEGVVFRGIVFTGCGPQESNVFLNHSAGLVCWFSPSFLQCMATYSRTDITLPISRGGHSHQLHCPSLIEGDAFVD